MAQFNPTESQLRDLTFAGELEGDMSGDLTSDSFYLNGTNNYALEYVIDVGTAVGSLELQGSNVELNPNYIMIASHSIAADTTGGMFNVDKGKYRYVRIVYTSTGGTATMTANINIGVS